MKFKTVLGLKKDRVELMNVLWVWMKGKNNNNDKSSV